MSEKPILFNTEMVKAILEGRKTCTRRIIKPKYSNTHLEMFTNKYGTRLVEKQNEVEGETFGENEDGTSWHKLLWMREIEDNPPYKIGDILYVRETYLKADYGYHYKADIKIPSESEDLRRTYGYKWRPSIHMPKEAARIFLKVTDVRVERLQDITEDGAISEGIREYTKDGNVFKYCPNIDWWESVHAKIKSFRGTYWQDMPRNPIEAFKYLWNSTVNKKDLWNAWAGNPWVWVISFERIERGDDL